MFSKTSEYAIKIMIYLSANSTIDNLRQVKEVSEALGTPGPFTAKILQQLVKAGLLFSMKGKNGGFTLSRELGEIKISDIVIAVDGEKSINRCLLGLKDCSSEYPCPLHHKFYKIKDDFKKYVLDSTLEV
ncbi:Rrf2 family transcriptional regulator [Apibacter sp. B3889]|uniref:RrF2 family transcriptional regulator n=1 Tax=unclassified Apibacter TaxID=2630820 RepID=UPI001328D187|nr:MULTISPECIES: Rrf2 family transcriptional regulator [unclassified Apibacter]MXO33537.1 Rrf2 family transcriptional regulator [Apibacter sp. B3883]MXO40894.1 Rrf2 family transcriptional regulator [Apibacter sp. B3889]MXP04063.1 Rrf2 family transcriptional regulator [Apibacter sp. B3887]MXP07126.1 Rrf2 family transcriptional regulator [Apibacter sp. B3935]